MNYIHYYESPLGRITLVSDEEFLTGLWFDEHKYFPDTLINGAEEKNLPILKKTDEWLDIYFSGKMPNYVPPIKMDDTSFRKRIWEILLKIPYGKTTTYGKIAALVAKESGNSKMSAQAVGGAVGHNPISIIIPCHRVVGTNGSLTGYGGGIIRKVMLLELEGVDMTKFVIPKNRDI